MYRQSKTHTKHLVCGLRSLRSTMAFPTPTERAAMASLLADMRALSDLYTQIPDTWSKSWRRCQCISIPNNLKKLSDAGTSMLLGCCAAKLLVQPHLVTSAQHRRHIACCGATAATRALGMTRPVPKKGWQANSTRKDLTQPRAQPSTGSHAHTGSHACTRLPKSGSCQPWQPTHSCNGTRRPLGSK